MVGDASIQPLVVVRLMDGGSFLDVFYLAVMPGQELPHYAGSTFLRCSTDFAVSPLGVAGSKAAGVIEK